jgi:TetR/AcrR family transcriptional regulator, tetracycline repressor protein
VPTPVKARRSRRPRGSLTRAQVVEAALELADQEGIEALTMPNLARRLECGVMTIYGYVESKEDLLAAIAQIGLRDLRLPQPPPQQPDQVLVAWGRSLRRTLLGHPSLPMIFLSQPVIGQAILRGVEALLGRLSQAGMQPARGVHAIYAVLTYASGFVAWEIPRTRRQSEAAYAASWRRAFADAPSEQFRITGTVLDELGKVAGEDQFEIGLAALAAGLCTA